MFLLLYVSFLLTILLVTNCFFQAIILVITLQKNQHSLALQFPSFEKQGKKTILIEIHIFSLTPNTEEANKSKYLKYMLL